MVGRGEEVAMQDERRLAVLRAIVEDYVATQEPVGSKALVERHGLGVSPATVRNDMAALEEEGLITQPTPAPAASRRTRATGCSSTG
jgi:transcriptional regulator of heat shock response